ncbi:MAG: biotin--[acetyl-CoA-carboxylase] ligase [Porphyromonadaceae bacterium]|nr:biotin--[acetyl-CoA-carboxylase] ligase [Porphyromonadaceae bacterium]
MNTTPNTLVILNEVDSTNSYLMNMLSQNRDLPQLFTIMARSQFSGRGQRGNSWITRPNSELTCSILLRDGSLSPSEQYTVSELAAYGLLKTIARYLPEENKHNLSIKWPNDIYYGDKKIAGILIEHSITGENIDYSIIGIGLNLNETDFPSDLPNPISLKQITGEDYEPEEVMLRLRKRFHFMLEEFLIGNYAEIHRNYMLHLYRREGLHPFSDRDGSFLAYIKNVLPTGQIVLEREDGTISTYAFKEVQFDVH